MLGTKIKGDEVCAWCGIHMHGIGHQVADDHVCMKCFRNHLIEKRSMKLLWEGVEKHGLGRIIGRSDA